MAKVSWRDVPLSKDLFSLSPGTDRWRALVMRAIRDDRDADGWVPATRAALEAVGRAGSGFAGLFPTKTQIDWHGLELPATRAGHRKSARRLVDDLSDGQRIRALFDPWHGVNEIVRGVYADDLPYPRIQSVAGLLRGALVYEGADPQRAALVDAVVRAPLRVVDVPAREQAFAVLRDYELERGIDWKAVARASLDGATPMTQQRDALVETGTAQAVVR